MRRDGRLGSEGLNETSSFGLVGVRIGSGNGSGSGVMGERSGPLDRLGLNGCDGLASKRRSFGVKLRRFMAWGWAVWTGGLGCSFGPQILKMGIGPSSFKTSFNLFSLFSNFPKHTT